MRKIKIGVIGVGYLGRIHAAKYKTMNDVDLVGVADSDGNIASNVASSLGVRMFVDYHNLLDCVDAVSIVVPTKNHFEVALHCLEKGVDILVEKPMTVTVNEADILISKAESCNRILQVGHIEQFNPAIIAMEQYLTSPIFIEAQRMHSFNSRGADVDVVLDLMIHDLDIILGIVPSPLKSMHSVGAPVITSTSDIANTRLLFENGCTANITASRISKKSVRCLRIFQPESYMSIDYQNKAITITRQLEQKGAHKAPKEENIHLSFPEKDTLETELRAFVLNVKQRSLPKIDGRVGRRVIKTAIGIIEQMKNHLDDHKDLFLGD